MIIGLKSIISVSYCLLKSLFVLFIPGNS